jgi:purine nucleosidase
MSIDRRRFLSVTAAAGILAACGRSFAEIVPAVAASPVRPLDRKKKVLLDTDIGSDIDDAIALSYLLAQPECDLLGITTVTGEPMKRAEIASALCHEAKRPDIPIYPGAGQPLVVAQRQPHAPQHVAVKNWPRQTNFPCGEAVEFMRRTIRAHPGEITLLAVGPLTNLALLFKADPEIPHLLKEVVLMCGQFDPKLKVPGWGDAEWNAASDPEATAIVFNNAVALRSYGLDVTLKVVMGREEVARTFSQSARLRPVLDIAQVWFAEQKEIMFHDPLAAVSVFSPDICRLATGRVTIDLKEGPEKGRTLWQPDPTGGHKIALAVSPRRFFASYFGVVRAAAA